MDKQDTLPKLTDLATSEFTCRQWLTYYKNIWNRNLIARAIDVQSDLVLKAINPEEMVEDVENGRPVVLKVKERLEKRKILVQDALDLITSIDTLLAIDDAKLQDHCFSKEALKVAEDMIPKPAEVGESEVGGACTLEDGSEGIKAEVDGKIVCVKKTVEGESTSSEAKV